MRTQKPTTSISVIRALTKRQRTIRAANLEAVTDLERIGYVIVTEPARLKWGLPESTDHLYLYRKRHGQIDLFTVSLLAAAEYVGCRCAVQVRGDGRVRE